MDRSLILFAIGLVFGGGIGFVAAAGNGITLDGHDHADHGHGAVHGAPSDDGTGQKAGHDGHGEGHAHEAVLSLPAGPQAPSLEIGLTPDPHSGWNLEIRTANFQFSPANAGRDHVDGEGHAHVYVNGVKVARQYGPWLHLPELPQGGAVVEVTLNTNDHRRLAVDGQPLTTRLEIGER